MKVYKQDLERDIKAAQWEQYSTAGWTQKAESIVAVEKANEVINLKPAAKVKAAVEQANDDTITTQGE
jgi:hypothetical protein